MGPSKAATASALGANEHARLVWLAYLVAGAALCVAGLYPVSNPDTFGHLAQGRQIALLGHVPLRDSFSFWRAQPALWRNYEWLSDLLSYRLYAWSGVDALLGCKCVLLTAAGALLVGFAHLRGGARAALLCALMLVTAIPAARFRFSERPEMVALPLVAFYWIGLSYLMRAWGAGRRGVDTAFVLGLGLAHALWVNLHGSHLLGLAVTSIHFGCAWWLGVARRELTVLLLLQLLASCVSPYGPAILTDAIAHLTQPEYRVLVSEWSAWEPSDPLWFLLAPLLQSALLLVCAPWLWRSGGAGRALLLCNVLLAVACFRSIRFVAEYVLLGAPAVAVGLANLLREAPWRKLAGAVAGTTAVAAVVVTWSFTRLPPYVGIGHGPDLHALPAGSAAWLAQSFPRPRVLATVEDSWFLMFELPGAHFLQDGRAPFYGPEHMWRVRAAFSDEAALRSLLEDYKVDTVIVRHTFKPHRLLLAHLRARSDWTLASIEDCDAVFVRSSVVLRDGQPPTPLALIPEYEPGGLLAANETQAASLLAELGRLPTHDNTLGYRSWVRALLSLRAQLRAGPGDGLRAPANAAEVTRLRLALARLRRAAFGAQGVPVVHAYHALVATQLCALAEAETAFAHARAEGDSRETLLGAQELALRRGDAASVRAFLAQASALPGAAQDPWLAALREAAASPPRCP